MALELIDTQTTDSNGEASITYTGTGAGEIEFRAKVSTLLQETSVVYDCFIVDTGLTGTFNTDNIDLNLTVDPDHSTGTLISNTQSSGTARRIFNNSNIGTDGNDITSAFCLEFEIVEYTGNTRFNFYQTGSYANITDVIYTNLSAITNGCKVRIVHDGSKYTVYSDTGSGYQPITGLTNIAHEWNTGRFAFMMQTGVSIKYKNFKVYPI